MLRGAILAFGLAVVSGISGPAMGAGKLTCSADDPDRARKACENVEHMKSVRESLDRLLPGLRGKSNGRFTQYAGVYDQLQQCTTELPDISYTRLILLQQVLGRMAVWFDGDLMLQQFFNGTKPNVTRLVPYKTVKLQNSASLAMFRSGDGMVGILNDRLVFDVKEDGTRFSWKAWSQCPDEFAQKQWAMRAASIWMEAPFLEAGEKALKSKDMDTAKENFEAAERMTRSGKGATGLSKVYLAAGDYVNALASANSALQRDGKSVDALVVRAVAYENMQLKDRAVEDYVKALELNPSSSEAKEGLKRLRPSPADLTEKCTRAPLKEAVGVCTDIISRLTPPSAEAFNARGRGYLYARDVDKSLEDFSRAIELNPKYADAYENRATAHTYKDNRVRAIADYSKAIELDPKSSIRFYSRGSQYAAWGELDLAIADFTKTIELEPSDSSGYHDRGTIYHRKGERERAIADMTKAVEFSPTSAYRVYSRGNMYFELNELDRALADQNKALELDGKYKYALLSRAKVRLALGDHRGAVGDITSYLEMQPDDASAYQLRGQVHEDLGELTEATKQMLRAVELAPKSSQVAFNYGLLLYNRGQFKEAAQQLRTAADAHPDAYTMIFSFLARSRQGEDAVAELTADAGRLPAKSWPYAVIEFYNSRGVGPLPHAAAKNGDETCEAHFYVGQWQLLKGNGKEAAASLKTAADTCPKAFIEHRSAHAELKRLGQ